MAADRIHPKDMARDELLALVHGMSWLALDLAQHLNFTNEMLRPELREEAYKRAEKMAYELCWLPYSDPKPNDSSIDIVVFGEKGLERIA